MVLAHVLAPAHGPGPGPGPGPQSRPIVLAQNSKEIENDSIFFKVNGKLQKIKLSHILFFESMSDYVKIITKEKTYVVLQTMTKLQNRYQKTGTTVLNSASIDACDWGPPEIKPTV